MALAMTNETKQTMYWTVGIVAALMAVVAILYGLGVVDTATMQATTVEQAAVGVPTWDTRSVAAELR